MGERKPSVAQWHSTAQYGNGSFARGLATFFQFITPHASDMLALGNVAPYYEIHVYKTTRFQYLPGRRRKRQALGYDSFPCPEYKGAVLNKSNYLACQARSLFP